MASPTTCVFDLSPPRRPGLDDVGGAVKEDDQASPPDPVTMLTAADANQWARLLVALGKVCPVAVLSVRYDGSNVPFVYKFLAAGSNVVIATLTVAETSVGVVQITWPANTFPASGAEPMVALNYTAPGGMRPAIAETIANGVRITTHDAVGSGVRAAFTVAVY